MTSSFGKFPGYLGKKLVGSLGLAISFLLAALPQSFRDRIGDLIGVFWFDVLRIRRRVAIDNIGIAYPELSLVDRTKMARWSLRHMGRTIVDFSLFPFFSAGDIQKNFEFSGMENFENAYNQGKGVLVLSLHLGNGDMGVAAMSRLGWPVSLISKTFKTRWLNDMWFGMRAKHGTQFIPPEKSSFQILRAIKNQRVVFFVLDQYMGPPVGCRTTFFGRETGTAMGLAIIAERSRSPVVPAYAYRRDDGKHGIVFGPEIPWITVSSGDENIASMTQIYTDKIEEMIRQHPEQWMWIHRRWKKFG